ncbi:hypothetical protein EZS27_018899 [termite gut metagenome]|uniref:Uncharacterized protein n=1 Tax=termite gut metagenome TaxID=433724 RepID=A0A5J4RHY3_9ZZZZ
MKLQRSCIYIAISHILLYSTPLESNITFICLFYKYLNPPDSFFNKFKQALY